MFFFNSGGRFQKDPTTKIRVCLCLSCPGVSCAERRSGVLLEVTCAEWLASIELSPAECINVGPS